jgi:hypothetical protein
MAKVRAKGKVKREQEATDAEKIQKKLEDQVEVRDAKSRARNSDVGFNEMVNVIADSMERVTDELGMTRYYREHRLDMRLSLEEGARVIAGSLMYGVGPHGTPVKIREADQNFKYCKEHK